MKNSFVLFFFLVLSCEAFCFDEAFILTEEMVVESAIRHYPKIYLSEEKINLSRAKFVEADGAFDSKIEVKNKSFTSGYYDGAGYLESKVSKPLPFANMKVYGGYNKTQNQTYPELNQYYNTKDGGRAIAGFEVSLIRGFFANEQNTIKQMANFDVRISEISNSLMLAQVKADARKAFWRYFYLHKIVKIYHDMLLVAKKRQIALEKQVKRGEKAAIILDENKRNIFRRESMLTNIKRELANNAVSLTMFLRNEEGSMKNPDSLLSSTLGKVRTDVFEIEPYNLDHILQNRFDVKISEVLLGQGKLKTKLAKNEVLPVLDLAVETSKDYGDGAKEKDQASSKIALSLTVPLENNKQNGKFYKARSELKIAERELLFLKDIISNEIRAISNRINEVKIVISNTTEEVKIAKKLVEAEKIRFFGGDSDFFVLNAREQDLLSIMEYELRNKLALTEMAIEYHFMTKDSLVN